MASNTGSSGYKGSGIKGQTKASKRGKTQKTYTYSHDTSVPF